MKSNNSLNRTTGHFILAGIFGDQIRNDKKPMSDSEFKEALQVFSKDSSNMIITKDDLPHFLR